MPDAADYAATAARLDAEADALEARARSLREAARALRAAAGLPADSQSGSLTGSVEPEHRLARSVSITETRGKASDLHGACVAAGLSVRQLAERIKVSHSYLLQAATGVKPASANLRARVQGAIGWSNWPPRQPRKPRAAKKR